MDILESRTQIDVAKSFYEIGSVLPGFHESPGILVVDELAIGSITEPEPDGFGGIRAMSELKAADGLPLLDGELEEAVDYGILGIFHARMDGFRFMGAAAGEAGGVVCHDMPVGTSEAMVRACHRWNRAKEKITELQRICPVRPLLETAYCTTGNADIVAPDQPRSVNALSASPN